MASGDVDGDGFADLVTGNYHAANILLLNDRKGSFVDATTGRLATPTANATCQVDLGDLDGDGDLDLVACNDHHLQNRLYLNDGLGSFTDVTASNLPAHSDWTESQVLVDVDGDGDLDIVFGNLFSQDRLYLNNGSAVFTDASTNLPSNSIQTDWIATGDLNGDSLPDLLLSEMGSARVLLNTAAGSFAPAPSGFLPAVPGNIPEIADLNADGRDDILLNGGRTLLTAQARGGFADVSATNLPPGNSVSGYLLTADIDLDGDLDLVGGQGVWLNDGSARFTDVTPTRMPVASRWSGWQQTIADFDGDGDPDLCAGYYHGCQLMMNFDRQLNAPTEPTIGAVYTLDVNARPGYASTAHLALPLWSVAEGSTWLSGAGHLGLEPGLVFSLSLVTVPQTTGVASLQFAVPNEARLRGVRFVFQALILDPAAPRQLSNTVADTIR